MSYWGNDSAKVTHVAVLSVFCFFALVAVICRFWARKIQRSKYQANDWFCLAGLVWALGLAIFIMHSNIYWGLGEETIQYGSPEAILDMVILQVKAMVVGRILCVIAVFLLRASIVSLYVHIFRTKPFRMACYVVHSINSTYFAATVLACCLVCRPISANWNPGAGTCGNQKSLDLFIGIFNLIMDVTVVILPFPIVWKLQMTRGKKIALSAIFGMGIIICVVTLSRIWVTTLIQPDNMQQMYSLIALLTGLESLLGVINCCLPVIRPVFTKFGNSKFWSSCSSGIRPGTHNCKRGSNEQAGNGLQNWSSSNQNLAPRFLDNKAATIMFSHCNPSTSFISGGGPTRPSPKKSTVYDTKSEWDDGKSSGITVQRDWEVERGDI